MDDGRLFVRVPEAALRLGIGKSKLYELMAEGEISVVRIGRGVRVPVHVLAEYAERLEREQIAGH